ncbi:hypothetical protein XELAEV_18012648mg [Xenopus laevis]|uniref:Uncharacterized protein n=1 Tax=Xenopus laevis TaxID=8355 RepID=A0A974DN00_XENLA|nr:hypothetical protein XELAEV_18012648mg [Xenopus laevis]
MYSMFPEVCLLGLVEDLLPLNRTYPLMRITLYYSKKLVVMGWMGHSTPLIKAWVKLTVRWLDPRRSTPKVAKVVLYIYLTLGQNCFPWQFQYLYFMQNAVLADHFHWQLSGFLWSL